MHKPKSILVVLHGYADLIGALHDGKMQPSIKASLQLDGDYIDMTSNLNELLKLGSELCENLHTLQILFGREIVTPILTAEFTKMSSSSAHGGMCMPLYPLPTDSEFLKDVAQFLEGHANEHSRGQLQYVLEAPCYETS